MRYRYKSISILMFENSDLVLSNNDEVDVTFRIRTPSFLYADIFKDGKHASMPAEPSMFDRMFRKIEG